MFHISCFNFRILTCRSSFERLRQRQHKIECLGPRNLLTERRKRCRDQGLEALKPCRVLADELARTQDSDLIKKDGKTYMGKSIVSVLSACVKCGTEIELVADGNDEAQALQDMVSAVNSGLGE